MKKVIILVTMTCLELFTLIGCNNDDFLRQKITQSFVAIQSGSACVINCKKSRIYDRYKTYILTVDHAIINNQEYLSLRFPLIDNNGYQYNYIEKKGRVIYRNAKYDFAILVVKTEFYITPTKVNLHRLKLMDKIYQIGRPIGTTFFITEGKIASLNYPFGMFGHNANSYYGSSGSPCFNSEGEQIGMSQAMGKYQIDFIEYPVSYITRSLSIRTIKQVLGQKDFAEYFNS